MVVETGSIREHGSSPPTVTGQGHCSAQPWPLRLGRSSHSCLRLPLGSA